MNMDEIYFMPLKPAYRDETDYLAMNCDELLERLGYGKNMHDLFGSGGQGIIGDYDIQVRGVSKPRIGWARGQRPFVSLGITKRPDCVLSAITDTLYVRLREKDFLTFYGKAHITANKDILDPTLPILSALREALQVLQYS